MKCQTKQVLGAWEHVATAPQGTSQSSWLSLLSVFWRFSCLSFIGWTSTACFVERAVPSNPSAAQGGGIASCLAGERSPQLCSAPCSGLLSRWVLAQEVRWCLLWDSWWTDWLQRLLRPGSFPRKFLKGKSLSYFWAQVYLKLVTTENVQRLYLVRTESNAPSFLVVIAW